ncbi:MAG: NYN domain-containing protein [bacterium]
MFNPKTDKIEKIARSRQGIVKQLDNFFEVPTRFYIDYANVRPWSNKLKWHIDLGRLKQFLDSFSTIEAVNFYNGYIESSPRSRKEIQVLENHKYTVRTKPVKIMRFPIDASSISQDSTALLGQFIRRALLRKYEVGTIEYLNDRFRDMNKKGEYYIEDRKCNFDVEIGVDMLLDLEKTDTEHFVLWSGDSDFADPLDKLLKAGKKVSLFATARRVSRELSELRGGGLIVFDIKKIRNFICWNKEIESKEDLSEEAPKLKN